MRTSFATLGRALALFMGSVLAIGLIAAPAEGRAPHTWYVAPSGARGGSCAHPDFHRIQPAIDALGPGDTILVCPGRYWGCIRIMGSRHEGLRVQAVKPRTAAARSGR